MASSAEMLSFAIELVYPMWMEVFMFSLAALVYVFFAGGLSSVLVLSKKAKKAKEASPEKSKPIASQVEAKCQPALRALRQGHIAEALEHCGQLPQPLSLPLATRVLVALGRSSQLTDEVVDRLMSMTGAFSSAALEAAAAEAQRSRNLDACRRLYQVAGLSSIPKTERAIDALVRGLSSDPAAMRALLEEVTAEGSAVTLRKPLLNSLTTLCASAPALQSLAPGARRPSLQHVDLMKHARAITAFGKDGDLKAAVALFDELKTKGVPTSPLIYNCLMEACVHCHDLRAAREYLERAKGEGHADVVSYNTVMKGCLSAGDLKGGQRLLQDMSKSGVSANHITYHGLLHALVLHGDAAGVWRTVGQMKEAGLSANAVTCSILLKLVASRSHGAGLSRVLKLVDEDKVPMDEVLFSSVTEACIRTWSLDVLSKRMRSYAEQGGLAKLSAPTYGSMIKAYGQAGDVARVWELWAEMSQRQVVATSVTLGCMVDALVTNHLTDDAWSLVQGVWEDPAQRALVNNVIYSNILKGFAMARQHDKVTKLYEEMKKRDVQPNTITYNTILNSLARCGLMPRAGALLEDMRAAEVEPDLVTYSTIIKGYCQCGDLDKSLQLLQEMRREKKIAPDEVMYNSLLDGCARQQRLDDALKLLDEMRDAGVAPSNYTLSIVSKLLGRARRLNQALAMVETISREYGFKPNIQVYTCLMQACFHNRQLGTALQLHDKIVGQGVIPDERTYTVLVRGFLQAGAVDKAERVLRCAFHLPGHGLLQAPGSPAGVEPASRAEVLSALGAGSASAAALEAELASLQRAAPRQAGQRSRKC